MNGPRSSEDASAPPPAGSREREPLFWQLVHALLVQPLKVPRSVPRSPESYWEDVYVEAERLIREDADFSYLNGVWTRFGIRGVGYLNGVWTRFGIRENPSIPDLRQEATRWRLIERHPWQWVRTGILTSTSGAAVGVWFGLGAGLEGLEGYRPTVQVIVAGFAFAVGSFFAWGLVTAKSRKAWLQLLEPTALTHGVWGLPALALVTLWILAFATLGFAGMSKLLYLHGIATTTPDHALTRPLTDAGLFYLWSLLKAIPVLEIPQTLGWELHFRFTDHVSPVLLLLYKVVVISPLIATGRLVWKGSRVGRQA